jgi:outer membrane lipoprotein-sorting protein
LRIAVKFLRRISTRQLLALCASVVVFVIGATVIAMATTAGGPKPAPRKLPVAVHEALAAKPVAGVSARIQFTNDLVAGSTIQGSDPILTGASGRLWGSASGHLRLELQSDASAGGGSGDAQVLVDHRRLTVYDSSANTAYEAAIPPGKGRAAGKSDAKIPSVATIKRAIAHLAKRATISGAIPSDVAGRPAYTVRVSPRQGGGLLGGAELAWDAVHGTPLRAAVYARGSSSPVLELKVTDISFGPVSSSVFDVTPPASAKVTDLSPPRGGAGRGHEAAPVSGAGAVAKRTPFALAAPKRLAGLRRGEVRLVSSGRKAGALVTYGRGLGGIAVLETPAQGRANPRFGAGGEGQPGLKLPTVSINGASGEELDTALGTVLRFRRGGVDYTVAGSVPPATVEAAARGL